MLVANAHQAREKLTHWVRLPTPSASFKAERCDPQGCTSFSGVELSRNLFWTCCLFSLGPGRAQPQSCHGSLSFQSTKFSPLRSVHVLLQAGRWPSMPFWASTGLQPPNHFVFITVHSHNDLVDEVLKKSSMGSTHTYLQKFLLDPLEACASFVAQVI